MLNIKAEIKALIGRNCTSLLKVINGLNENGTIKTSYSNIANKINTKTITFDEVQNIIDFLGYRLTIEQKTK